ncbi:MAG: hypothetical protein ACRDQ9_17840 [Pseudonocardiaceae bacterium]
MALRGIGDTEQAITFSTMVLCGCDPWMVRPLCVTQAGLALIHLHARDLEQAAALGRDALRTAASLTTTPPDGQLPRRCHRATAGLHRTAHRPACFADRRELRQHGCPQHVIVVPSVGVDSAEPAGDPVDRLRATQQRGATLG